MHDDSLMAPQQPKNAIRKITEPSTTASKEATYSCLNCSSALLMSPTFRMTETPAARMAMPHSYTEHTREKDAECKKYNKYKNTSISVRYEQSPGARKGQSSYRVYANMMYNLYACVYAALYGRAQHKHINALAKLQSSACSLEEIHGEENNIGGDRRQWGPTI